MRLPRARRYQAAFAALFVNGGCTQEIANLGSPPDADVPPQDSAAAAECPVVIDQQAGVCTSPPITQCGNMASGTPRDGVVQVFTPSRSGVLPRVRLWMWNDEPALNTVEISIADLAQNPSALLDTSFVIESHILATARTPMTSQDTWQDVVFSRPPAVVANRPYAIYMHLLASPGSFSSARWVMYNDYLGPQLDVYPRGGPFGRGPGTNDLWVQQPASGDLVFEAHVAPTSCP